MEQFTEKCNEIMSGMDPLEIIRANKVVFTISKINNKNPLLYLPDFVESFIYGVPSRKLVKLYNFNMFSKLGEVQKILEFNGHRSKISNSDNSSKNLSNHDWGNRYDILNQCFDTFAIPISELYHNNLLRAFIIRALLKYHHIAQEDLKEKILESYSDVGDAYLWPSSKIKDSFDKYLKKDIEKKIHMAVIELAKKSHVTNTDLAVSVFQKYIQTTQFIQEAIETATTGITYDSLSRKTLNEFPLLKMTFWAQTFDNVLNQLENENHIVRKRAFWRFSPSNDQLFTRKNYDAIVAQENKNYEIMMEKQRMQKVAEGRIKFFGRQISPDQFIDELKMLDVGDIDDQDDQVTRIAGLILSDSIRLQHPRENLQDFDFLVDVTDYNFRSESKLLMEKLDFKITGSIFHCKVMINEEITRDIISRLKNIVPAGEQCVIFTCMQVKDDVLKQTKTDPTIQIIDQEGIRGWSSITTTIPCRRNSVAQVMYGDGRGKTVLVKSLNYESGLATVKVISDHTEAAFPIRCLKEIDLNVSMPGHFESASKECYDFLCYLADISHDPFDNVFETRAVRMHSSRIDLMKSRNPELFGGSHPEMQIEDDHSNYKKYVEFNNVCTTIDVSRNKYSLFECECGHSLNEESHKTLCKHVVSAIMHICEDGLGWSIKKKYMQIFKNKLVCFEEQNIERMCSVIYVAIKDEHRQSFIQYIQCHANDEDESDLDNMILCLKNDIQTGLKNESVALALFNILDTKITVCNKEKLHYIIEHLLLS